MDGKVPPTFNVPADVAIPTSVQGWEEDLSRCERQMHERQLRYEQLEREDTEEGAA